MEDVKQTTYDKVMQKSAEKKQAVKDRKEERIEQGIVNQLVIESIPNGLYKVRYSLSGPVPEELRGLFTRKDRILDIANRKGLQVAANG
tara:strand:+ start:255 stop:521 length:267 start_codon:yes stop_codon:yes gene_type:complete